MSGSILYQMMPEIDCLILICKLIYDSLSVFPLKDVSLSSKRIKIERRFAFVLVLESRKFINPARQWQLRPCCVYHGVGQLFAYLSEGCARTLIPDMQVAPTLFCAG